MTKRNYHEEAFQRMVVAQAMHAGWMVHCTPDSMWRRAFVNKTPITDLGQRGFPDLVIAREGVVLYRELKVKGGKLSEYQQLWRDELIAAGCDWAIWWEHEFDDVVSPELWGDRLRGQT